MNEREKKTHTEIDTQQKSNQIKSNKKTNNIMSEVAIGLCV